MVEKPIWVEIIAYAPTAFYHCTHCEVAWRETGALTRLHEEQVENSLPADLVDDYQKVSDWVHEITYRYCDRVAVKVIDAASVEGFFASLRHRVHRYPAVIINNRTFRGVDGLKVAGEEIARTVESVAAGPGRDSL